ncbi:type 1 glutamine amidotransferase domain-containing protein [Thalassotalea sp. HSM 43]|uniref:type 1 glutamine amidotransferase domain-containing protein n=1 Tax=Thalassotalea sp. HSM 43 TaxID=2552945 RepID=UPI0016721C07|nr:type 1 glutamine amidotransferase domain-containing protein [Thalassotalea sp. HSM 43]
MKQSITTLLPMLAVMATPFISNANQVANDAPKILMVLSSYGEKNSDGELVKPGYEFDEMSKSYLVFKAAGTHVTFASPKGGELVTDQYDAKKAYNAEFLADESAVKALSSSLKLTDVNADEFDAVYIVGGKGPMYDLATDPQVKTIIKDVYEDNGIVAAVCHGPAALLDVKLSDNSYLVDGKRISAFTNLEESVFTKKWQLPFSLQDKLQGQGANYQQDGLMLNQVSIDGRIITGQNPFSTADSAVAVVAKLGLDSKDLPRFKDDNTIKLMEQFYADSDNASATFKAQPEQYNPMLLAMIGVYQAKHAQSEVERNVALQVMQQTQDIINHPMLDITMAKTFIVQNEQDKAISLLKASQLKFPENEQISGLLNKLAD